MTPERWRRITDVFHAARGRNAASRSAFLDQACAADLPLRVEVDALLAADTDAGAFGEGPALGLADEAPLEEGATLGPYCIETLIGESGMGEVYRARRPSRTLRVTSSGIRSRSRSSSTSTARRPCCTAPA